MVTRAVLGCTFRRGGVGGTDLARWAHGAALAASRLSRGRRRAAIDPDFEPPPRPDLRPSISVASRLAPSGGATRNPDAAADLASGLVGAARRPQRVGPPVPSRPHRQGRREPGREASPAAADLRWSVQSGPRFGGEGDIDGSVGPK
ncbi:hypothetical protein MUG91_G6n681, partial [Manis pentadactyla]